MLIKIKISKDTIVHLFLGKWFVVLVSLKQLKYSESLLHRFHPKKQSCKNKSKNKKEKEKESPLLQVFQKRIFLQQRENYFNSYMTKQNETKQTNKKQIQAVLKPPGFSNYCTFYPSGSQLTRNQKMKSIPNFK